MNKMIRPETTMDYPEIYKLIQTAFETAKVKDGDEQDFAVRLRESGNYIPELALVAECENRLIGHIMFTRTYVLQPDGSRFDVLLVAPLSVLQEYRGQGIGSALMMEGLKLATSMGYKVAFLCGDPNYYQKFGYKPTRLYGIHHDQIPDEYVMAYELIPNSLSGVVGMIQM